MEKPSGAGAGIGALPAVADRATFQAELDALRVREKTHTREGDAIAAARRQLPMAGAAAWPGYSSACARHSHKQGVSGREQRDGR